MLSMLAEHERTKPRLTVAFKFVKLDVATDSLSATEYSTTHLLDEYTLSIRRNSVNFDNSVCKSKTFSNNHCFRTSGYAP